MKEAFSQAFRDRSFIIATASTAIALLAILVLCSFSIQPSEIQVPIRNTVFGITYTYREQWYNELIFPAFALLVAGFHTALSTRFYVLKDRRYAIVFQWLTTVILAVAFIMFIAIFRVIAVVS